MKIDIESYRRSAKEMGAHLDYDAPVSDARDQFLTRNHFESTVRGLWPWLGRSDVQLIAEILYLASR